MRAWMLINAGLRRLTAGGEPASGRRTAGE
jgi:hypothetical protein